MTLKEWYLILLSKESINNLMRIKTQKQKII